MDLTEEALWNCLRDIEVKFPVPIKINGGVTYWLLPWGAARGYNEFSNRGRLGPEITMWPDYHHYALYEGIGDTVCLTGRHFSALWPQEKMILAEELCDSLRIAMSVLGRGEFAPIPRKTGHLENDVTPYPEDFGLDVESLVTSVMIESLERWLKRMG